MSLHIEYYTIHPFKSSMVILFSNSLCYDNFNSTQHFGGGIWMPVCACIHLDALSTLHLAMYWSPVEHREFMSKPKKSTEKVAAAALQERINAEQGLPALWSAQKQWIHRSPVSYGHTYHLEQYVSEFGHLTAEAKYTQECCGWGWWGAMRCLLWFDTDELIKLLTRLGTFSCPGHQELATQCKKRNPGGSMFLPIHITCTEMRMAIIVSKKGGLRWQQMRKKPQRQGPLLTVQCGVASTLIEQVGLDGVIGVFVWAEGLTMWNLKQPALQKRRKGWMH